MKEEGDGPDEVYKNVPPLAELLAKAGIPFLQSPGQEADDLLASAGKHFEAKGFEVFLVAKDKDARQCITQKVKIFVPEMGSGKFARPSEIWDEKLCVKETKFTPKQYRDYQVLIGDAMDNVPPVLGKAEARSLLLKYGTLASYFKTKEGNVFLQKHGESLSLNRKMVTLRTDLWQWDDCKLALRSNIENTAYTELRKLSSKTTLF